MYVALTGLLCGGPARCRRRVGVGSAAHGRWPPARARRPRGARSAVRATTRCSPPRTSRSRCAPRSSAVAAHGARCTWLAAATARTSSPRTPKTPRRPALTVLVMWRAVSQKPPMGWALHGPSFHHPVTHVMILKRPCPSTSASWPPRHQPSSAVKHLSGPIDKL
jgi:hypothetical protein